MKNDAKAKAIMITELLRIAGDEGVSPTAQALLAIVIAESWPIKTHWRAKMGYPVLEHRLGVARNTLRKATRELELANLVRMKPGAGQRLSSWWLPNTTHKERVNLRPLKGSISNPGRGLKLTGEGQSQTPLRVNLRPPYQDNKIYSEAN